MRPINPQAIIIDIPDTDFQRFWDGVSSLVWLANLSDNIKPNIQAIINNIEVVINNLAKYLMVGGS